MTRKLQTPHQFNKLKSRDSLAPYEICRKLGVRMSTIFRRNDK